MAKERPIEISVSAVFDGKQSKQQAFIDLILHKHTANAQNKTIDENMRKTYNIDKVFSDVRVV